MEMRRNVPVGSWGNAQFGLAVRPEGECVMGWDFADHWTCKADVISEVTDPHRWGRPSKVLAIKNVRAGAWVVWEIEKPDGTADRFIECILVERKRGSYGYKTMDEGMHPYYYDCPIKFLTLAPVASEAWRAEVRAHAYAKSMSKIDTEGA